MAEVQVIEFKVDKFQSLLLDLPNATVEDYTFDGTPKKGEWRPPPVYSDYIRLPKPDIWRLVGAAVLVIPSRLVPDLEPHLSWAGELLPLPSEIDDFVLLNILKDIDCLDRQESDLEAIPPVLSFVEHRLAESGLF
jgi:hypothetical protein